MKKYLLFGLISGAVVSGLYPLYFALFSFSSYYGLSYNMVRILSFAIYAIIAMIAWRKYRVEFSISRLALFVSGSLLGMFGMIGFQYLYLHLWLITWSLPNIFPKIWGIVQLWSVLKVAFDFGDIYVIAKYISQLIMQIVPFVVMCKLNKKYKY